MAVLFDIGEAWFLMGGIDSGFEADIEEFLGGQPLGQ